VHLYVSEGQIYIDFHDNGAGLAGPTVTAPLTPYVDIDLTVAKQIIFDHAGELEILRSHDAGEFVRIRLGESRHKA